MQTLIGIEKCLLGIWIELYKSEEEYAGETEEYITLLTDKMIPIIEKTINETLRREIAPYTIAGYSLAELQKESVVVFLKIAIYLYFAEVFFQHLF